MKFTSLFIENLMGSTFSLVPTLTQFSISGTYTAASTLTLDGDVQDTTLGTTLTSTASAISDGVDTAYQRTLNQYYSSQAYIESLNQEEMEQLVEQLEEKELTLSQEEMTSLKEKTLKKEC